MKFTAAGDALIQQRIHKDFEGTKEIATFMEGADARFFNLETTLNYEGDCFASQFSGGTYMRTNPEVLDDLKEMGFNITSFNNNHSMDFSYDGLLQTFDYVKKSGLVQSGAGRNLDEASAPNYLDTPGGRVALIAVNTTFNPSMMAGRQTGRIKGRPGINGLRIEECISVTDQELAFIKELAESTRINRQKEITRKEGYTAALSDDEAELGVLKFKKGDKTERILTLNESDVKRVEKAIYEAKLQADYIMISIHTHELDGETKEDVPRFLRDFCHRCIDVGANAVIGHGPHLLRPIEVYKDSPIFYSLGDLVLQLYSVAFAPDEFFTKYGLTADDTVHALLKKRSSDFTHGLMEDVKMMQAVIPYWETDGTKLTKLSLMPILLGKGGNKSEAGLPRWDKEAEFIGRLAEMSKPYGVKMEMRDGIVSCTW